MLSGHSTSQGYQNLLRDISIGKSCHNLTHLPEFSARYLWSLSEIFLGMLTYRRYLLTGSNFMELRCCGILTELKLKITYYTRYSRYTLTLFLVNYLPLIYNFNIFYKDMSLELFSDAGTFFFIKCSSIAEYCFLTALGVA